MTFLKKSGRINARFKLGKERRKGCVAQWRRDLEEEVAKPSALHIKNAPRSIGLLFELTGHPNGSKIRNVHRQFKALN